MSGSVANNGIKITVDDSLLKNKLTGKTDFITFLTSNVLTTSALDLKKNMNNIIDTSQFTDEEAKVLFLLLKSMLSADSNPSNQLITEELNRFKNDTLQDFKKKNLINCIYLPNPTGQHGDLTKDTIHLASDYMANTKLADTSKVIQAYNELTPPSGGRLRDEYSNDRSISGDTKNIIKHIKTIP